jgi:hypothetical protein
MRKTGGIKPKIAFWIYRTILSPKLLYASAFCRSRVNRVEARNLPQSFSTLLPDSCRGIYENDTLEVALCHSLELTAIGGVGLTTYTLNCEREWKRKGFSYIKRDFLRKYLLMFNQDKILKKIPIGKCI